MQKVRFFCICMVIMALCCFFGECRFLRTQQETREEEVVVLTLMQAFELPCSCVIYVDKIYRELY